MFPRGARLCRIAGASFLLAGAAASAAGQSAAEVRELIESNRRLQEQVRAQQKTIEALSTRLDRLEGGTGAAAEPAQSNARERDGAAVRVTAEAGLAFFKTGRDGRFPEGEFRADDPVVAIEARVMKDVYFFTELKLLPRETNVEDFELGEMYVDFENVSGNWGQPGLMSVRVGRLNIPFGEEYLKRSPVANPLISHSLGDFWGVDEGVEIYGRVGPANYVVAVQNGGVSRLRDFHKDKAVAARIGWQPARWLSVSGSAMRTGKLSVTGDTLSELWIGNGFFRALGPTASTTAFWADLVEADATARWRGGHVSASWGTAWFDDDDTQTSNARRLSFGFVEVAQDVVERLYAAARYSEMRAPRGYPLPGWGTMGGFFFRPGALTEELRRLSVGLGYRFGPPLVFKVEYAWESGRMVGGARRDNQDFFGTELGVRF